MNEFKIIVKLLGNNNLVKWIELTVTVLFYKVKM